MNTLPTKFDAEVRHRFLQYYALTGQVQKSAQEVGISPTAVRALVKDDDTFAKAMTEAKEDYKEAIERELVRRAVMGWEEPVFQKGELVGTITKHSDRLLELLIKKLDPSYKENHQVEVIIGAGVLAAPAVETTEEWEKRNSIDADYEEQPVKEDEADEEKQA